MTLRNIIDLGKVTVAKWNEHNAPRLAAALAYYTLLSLAPVVVIVTTVYGLAFNRSDATQQLLNQAQNMLGYAGVNAIKGLTDHLNQTRTGVPAGIAAAIILVFGASGVFAELRDSLNTIWDAPEVSLRMRQVVLRRIFSVALVLALAVFLLASLLVSTALQMVQPLLIHSVPNGALALGEITNLLLSFLAAAVLFALIFKTVPDVPIDWKDVIIGAALTALLFTVGRWVLSIYLSKAGVGSAFGAAGSTVGFMVWVYYSSQIFFFGAILTRVYASQYGSKRET